MRERRERESARARERERGGGWGEGGREGGRETEKMLPLAALFVVLLATSGGRVSMLALLAG
jgi:hypothetical protein